MTTMSQKYIIRRDLAQAIADYLLKQPCGEVLNMVLALRQLEPAPEPSGEEKDEVAGSTVSEEATE